MASIEWLTLDCGDEDFDFAPQRAHWSPISLPRASSPVVQSLRTTHQDDELLIMPSAERVASRPLNPVVKLEAWPLSSHQDDDLLITGAAERVGRRPLSPVVKLEALSDDVEVDHVASTSTFMKWGALRLLSPLSSTGDEDGGDEDRGDDDEESELKLEHIRLSHTITLSIRSNYTNWAPWQAFRELVQNWRDAIITSFGVSEEDFKVVREERRVGSAVEIVYKAMRPFAVREKCMGYIYFSGRGGLGAVQITNRNASLQPWHLDLGGTSKSGQRDQAGSHGEGLKIALLVLMRGSKIIKSPCQSGNFDWNFGFNRGGKLFARLHRRTPKQILKTMKKRQLQVPSVNTLQPFTADPENDVEFIIGESGTGNDHHGRFTIKSQVKIEEFQDWLKAALFLQDVKHEEVIHTERGDLILGDRMRENLYLKGFLVAESTPDRSASITRKPLMHGYNFSCGALNRERQSLASAGEESEAIWAVWDGAINLYPALLERLSNILNSEDPEYADVSLATINMKADLARRLQEHLFSEEGANRWYYQAEEKVTNPRLDAVIDGLGRQATKLAKPYWTVLRHHRLIRTANEEEILRFAKADEAPIPTTSFASEVNHLLRACLKTSSLTWDYTLLFVRAEQLDLHIMVSEEDDTVRVNAVWLDQTKALKKLGFETAPVLPNLIYHTVSSLFRDAVMGIQNTPPGEKWTEDHSPEWYQKREYFRVDQCLMDYFRMKEAVKLLTTSARGELRVDWSAAGTWPNNTYVDVQVHRSSTCSKLRNTLLASETAEFSCLQVAAGRHRPLCCGITVPIQQGRTDIKYLDNESYFALIFLKSDRRSFVIVSENDCRPRTRNAAIAVRDVYGLGTKLDTPNPYQVSKNRWYEAVSGGSVKGMIGFFDKASAPGPAESGARSEPGERNITGETRLG